MTTVLRHLETAIRSTAKANAKTLKFISEFEGANGKDLRSRWELWLQIELMRQLDSMKTRPQDLYSEYRADYKANKHKGAGRAAKGFVSGSLDIAFRPRDGDRGLLAGLEIKVKRTASAAIRGGLHDLLKPRAFVTSAWQFRAMYSMCVYDTSKDDEQESKYLTFIKANGGKEIPLGKCFRVALIGWEAKPRSGDKKDFYAEYNRWMKELLAEAKTSNLTINSKPRADE